MTELLHARTTDHRASSASLSGPPTSLRETVTDDPLTSDPSAASPETAHSWLDDALLIDDLAPLSNRQLRIMSNHLFAILDTDFPPADAVDRFASVSEEIGNRERQARQRAPRQQPKETFRDNALYSRFELYVDGTLAAYAKYTMTGAHVHLTDGIEQPAYRDLGLDTTLMRHVMLNAHKRRLDIVPGCPMAFAFLADHPQYQTLAPRLRS
jgi:predicted GNAT family acetyltransferase